MTELEVVLAEPDFGFLAKDGPEKSISMDISPELGGKGKALNPMQTLLGAMAACSGIDVVSILKKQKLEVKTLKMKIKAEREANKVPALWKNIDIAFFIEGELDTRLVKRAVSLSMEKYCSVGETLRRAGAEISYTMKLNNEVVE